MNPTFSGHGKLMASNNFAYFSNINNVNKGDTCDW